VLWQLVWTFVGEVVQLRGVVLNVVQLPVSSLK
jgi:hypothetical protein